MYLIITVLSYCASTFIFRLVLNERDISGSFILVHMHPVCKLRKEDLAIMTAGSYCTCLDVHLLRLQTNLLFQSQMLIENPEFWNIPN